MASAAVFALLLGPVAAAIQPSETFASYTKRIGYESEVDHYATTDDGYILNLWRLPNPGKPVVFLQHGILASGWCWAVNDKSLSAAFVLKDAGYDVWLGNNRGNRWSKNHTTLKPSSKEFFDFTWEEMGTQDLPAMISYALQATGQKDLVLVGWSQGSTQFFAAASENMPSASALKSQVSLFIALSPVSFMKDGSGQGLLRDIAELHLAGPLNKIYPYGFLCDGKTEDAIVKTLCKLTLGEVCKITVDLICGTSDLDDKSVITDLTAHFPSGTSTKDLWHFQQLIDASSEFFGRFDYGSKENQEKYGQNTPPSYNLSSIEIPTAFFHGSNDRLVSAGDYGSLRSAYRNESVVFERSYTGFSHVTWMVARDEAGYWLNDLTTLIADHVKSKVAAPALRTGLPCCSECSNKCGIPCYAPCEKDDKMCRCSSNCCSHTTPGTDCSNDC